jgi:gamma-glutamylputrescine oxidase
VSGSYWLAEPRPPLLARSLDGDPEVVVVGGGITGCSAALTLARAGLRVRLHEAREIAGGASGRNGGFALRGGAMAYDRAREWLGPDAARAFWLATERALDELEALAGDAFRRVGSLRLAGDAEERDELRHEFEALQEDGFAVEWRDSLAPPLDGRLAGALFHEPDALLQPAQLVRRLAAAAAAAGVEFREWSRVESLADADAAAPAVLIATDGYPSGLLGELEGLIVWGCCHWRRRCRRTPAWQR